MKIFISADIEGVTTITRWDESDPRNASYHIHAEQMTNEVVAVCEGAFAAGAKEIIVRDAHAQACNINPTRLPKGVTLIRGWSNCPNYMIEGIDKSFDAAMFVGYHAAAGCSGNPMSHTLEDRATGIFINGRRASEFMIYSWGAAYYGVPTVFLSGDKTICENDADLHPALCTVAVKDGIGGATYNRSVDETIPELREKSEEALRQKLDCAKISLPDSFSVEVIFADQSHAEKVSHFPDVQKINANTVSFTRDDYYEVMRTLVWIV